MKEKYFQVLVDTYFESFKVDHIGDLITEITSPYDEIICELLEINDDEYQDMIAKACDMGQHKYFKKVLQGIVKHDNV